MVRIIGVETVYTNGTTITTTGYSDIIYTAPNIENTMEKQINDIFDNGGNDNNIITCSKMIGKFCLESVVKMNGLCQDLLDATHNMNDFCNLDNISFVMPKKPKEHMDITGNISIAYRIAAIITYHRLQLIEGKKIILFVGNSHEQENHHYYKSIKKAYKEVYIEYNLKGECTPPNIVIDPTLDTLCDDLGDVDAIVAMDWSTTPEEYQVGLKMLQQFRMMQTNKFVPLIGLG